jgi:alanyl aminopeptidase
MPNADAGGYYRFALAPNDLNALRTSGLASLSVREKIAFADSVRAGYSRGTTPMKDAVLAVAPLATDPDPHVAAAAMGYLESAREWLFSDALRPNVEKYAGSLYRRVFDKLGWGAAKGEDPARATLREQVLAFLVFTANDHELRAESVKLARAYLGVGKDDRIHAEAVDANLTNVVLAVAGEEADAALWDALLAHMMKTEDDALRSRLLTALGRARRPDLAERARAQTFDPRLRVTEALSPLGNQLDALETRDATWEWIKQKFDEILTRVPAHHGGPALLSAVDAFCDEAHAQEAETFLRKRAESIEGGPRALASAIEHVRLCAARRKAQEPSARDMFAHTARAPQ